MSLILGENLHLQATIPPEVDALPVYRVAAVRAFSRADESVRAMIDERVIRWLGAFPVRAEPVDRGDMISYLADDAALEVYLPSDSVWWTDRTAAFAEEPPSDPVPERGEAAESARRLIAELAVGEDQLDVTAVTSTNASSSRGPDEGSEPTPTMVTVTFGYTLGDVPVVGPGARIRVSYGGGGKLVEFARFWRNAEPVREVHPIHPYQAIERLANDDRFADLGGTGLEVSLDELRLSHYAAGPSVFQRYLVPVYEARGTVNGGELENDVFDVYISAVDADPATLKVESIRDKPSFRPVFTSF